MNAIEQRLGPGETFFPLKLCADKLFSGGGFNSRDQQTCPNELPRPPRREVE
ncbi:MAG TPA: hypothetical protein VGF73_11965 [Chthoniobacterales bacterium]